MHHKVSKEDPHGGNERAKGQHEANEKPNAGSCKQRKSRAGCHVIHVLQECVL